MAAAPAKIEQSDKKRVSKAVKRKAKKAPVEEDEVPEALPAAEAEADVAPEKDAVPRKLRKRTKANRLEKMEAAAEKEPVEPRGVIYLGHIPDGFAEPQMRKFFYQFGKVTRLRISRSKRTAKSKGYAFVEFEEEGVAKIVAETMQGYLLFDKTLVCHLLPKEKQHPMLFKGCKRRMINTTGLRRRKHTLTYNDRPTVEVNGEKLPRRTSGQAVSRTKADKKLAAILANLGVDYDLAGVDEGSTGREQPKASVSSPKVSPAQKPASAPAGAAASGSAPSAMKKKKRKMAA